MCGIAGWLDRYENLTEKQREVILRDTESLKSGIQFSPDRYIPFIFEGGETVLDYVGDAIFAVSEIGSISERFKSLEIQQSADVENYLNEGFLTAGTAKLWLDKTEFLSLLSEAVVMENFPRNSWKILILKLIIANIFPIIT